MTNAAFEGVHIEHLVRHSMPESRWNSDLWNLVKTAFVGSFFKGDPFFLEMIATHDLWDAKLSPSAAAFRDVPIQLQLVELVLKNKLKKDVRLH